jgi:hypothetical protein
MISTATSTGPGKRETKRCIKRTNQKNEIQLNYIHITSKRSSKAACQPVVGPDEKKE